MRRIYATVGVGLAALFAAGLGAIPAHAAGASIWIQTLDSCNHTLGSSQFVVADSSLDFSKTVTTPPASLHTVGGACPSQRGSCASAAYGCVQVTGLPLNDTFRVRETALPPANSGNPLGFAACNGGSACGSEYATFSVDGNGVVSGYTSNAYPDGTVALMPSGGTYAATSGDPIVFHDFGLGSGSCDADSDADDHLTGGPASHCAYKPETAEASACQPYPWSCTLTASALHFVLSSPGAVSAGTPFTETVTAQDSNNNTATSYSGGQALTWSGPSRSPYASQPIYPANPVTFNNGVAQVQITLVDMQTTSLSVTQDYLSGTVTGISVAPGSPSKLIFSGATQAAAGVAYTTTMTAIDKYGNITPSYAGGKTLKWSGPSKSPNLTRPVYPANPVSFANGSATVAVTPYDAQTVKLLVTDGTIKGSSPLITVAPGSTSQLAAVLPANATSGTPVTATAAAKDRWGNVATSDGSTLSVSSDDTAADSSPNNPNNVALTAGSASFQFTFYTPGSQTITVSGETYSARSNATTVQ